LTEAVASGAKKVKGLQYEEATSAALARARLMELLKQAEVIVPAKDIETMVAVHKVKLSVHPSTSYSYICKAIIADPKHTSQIAENVLSEDLARSNAALDKIGHPLPYRTWGRPSKADSTT